MGLRVQQVTLSVVCGKTLFSLINRAGKLINEADLWPGKKVLQMKTLEAEDGEKIELAAANPVLPDPEVVVEVPMAI